jgi:hypothetical protein
VVCLNDPPVVTCIPAAVIVTIHSFLHADCCAFHRAILLTVYRMNSPEWLHDCLTWLCRLVPAMTSPGSIV